MQPRKIRCLRKGIPLKKQNRRAVESVNATNERNNLKQEKKAENSASAVPAHAIDCLARCLLPELQKYFESEDGQKAFAEWKAQKS